MEEETKVIQFLRGILSLCLNLNESQAFGQAHSY